MIVKDSSSHRLVFLYEYHLHIPKKTLPDSDGVPFAPLQRTLSKKHGGKVREC